VRGKGTEGRVVIVSGKDGKRIRAIEPESGEHYLGTDLVALGDLDGDGKEDLLIRARVGGGPTEHERFVAISAANGKRLFAVESPPGVLSCDLGRPLARLFDLDGDGTPDFAVEFGQVVHARSGKDGKELKTFSSTTADKLFGYSMCAVRGPKPTLAIGDPSIGRVRIFAMQSDGGTALAGTKDLAGVGQSLAAIGDLDGDGVDEIAVGRSDGKAGGVLVLSGKDLEPVRTIEDEPADGRIPLGYRVAAGQDVDGDGKPDILVSRHWPTAAAKAQRSVVVVSGADGKRIRELVSPAAVPEQSSGKKSGR